MTPTAVLTTLALSVILVSTSGQTYAESIGADTTAQDESDVYVSFIYDWFGKGKGTLNVAREAEKLTPEEIGLIKECGGSGIEWAPASTTSDITRSLETVPIVRLVDSNTWTLSDPGELIAKGTSVDDAVKSGFSHGLFRLSVIQFDTKHIHAALSYSFTCGTLCGNGGVVVLEKRKSKWVRVNKRQCYGWVS